MGYYRLHCDQVQMTGVMEQEGGPAMYKLVGGETYQPKPGKLPFRFRYAVPEGRALFDYYSGDCLMSRRLVGTIERAGVDNLQVFPAVLTDQTTGIARDDYCVVNIIGLVAAAAMQESASIPLGGGQVFTTLVVDESRPQGLLMFRLAESLIDVIVHETVAEAIRAGEFRGVVLSPVSSAGG